MTTVVSVRGRKREELLADPNFVYVGRGCGRSGWINQGWGNPFKAGNDPGRAMNLLMSIARPAQTTFSISIEGPLTAEKAVEFFGHYVGALVAVSPDWKRCVTQLQGKTLGCWCGDWKPGEPEIQCHAVTLAKLADAL